jgi:tetratricopeptide (TPR) repeat protein
MPLELWLVVLVPFLASLFTRGLDFEERFDERLRELLSPSTYDELYPKGVARTENTNRARVMETMRLLAPVMRGSWQVMHNSNPTPLILNDRGLAAYLAGPGQLLYGFPLTPGHLLLLHEGVSPTVDYENSTVTSIQHREMTAEDVRIANANTFRFAIHEIYGPTSESLTGLGDWAPEEADKHLRLVGPDGLVPNGFDLRFHEGEWWERMGRFRARHNRMPRRLSLPVLAAVDLPMSRAHNLFLAQLELDLTEQALTAGRGEAALDHCSAAAERDPSAVRDWVARRLELPRFGRRRSRTHQEVAESASQILESDTATAFDACAAAAQLALIQWGRGQFEEARSSFRRAAVTSRDWEGNRLKTAILMGSLGELSGAGDALREVAEGDGKHAAEAMCRLGELPTQDIPAAAWFAAAAGTTNVEWSSRALFRLGDLARVDGKEAAALRYYMEAEKSSHATWSAAAFYHHGVYLGELGEPRRSLRLWRRAFDVGEGYWKARAGANAGRTLLSEDRPADAIRYLRYAAVSPIAGLKDLCAHLCGLAYLRMNDLDQARFWFERTSAEASGDLADDARLNLADVANRQGKRQESEAYIRWVAEGGSSTSRAKAALRLGFILEDEADIEGAKRSYAEAIELGEGAIKDHAMLALATILNPFDSVQALELASKAAKSSDPFTNAKAANLAGLVSLKSGDTTAAATWFETASGSRDPRQSPIALANHGGMLLDQGRADEGLRLLKQARRLQGPGAVLARLNLADYWENVGESRRAEHELQRALSSQGARYESLVVPQYAKFLAARGRVAEARLVLEHALPRSLGRRAREIRGVLEQLTAATEGNSRDLYVEDSVRIDIREEPPS